MEIFEKDGYIFHLKDYKTFMLVSVALSTEAFLPIASVAGFDRDYERSQINRHIRGVFKTDIDGLESIFFSSKNEYCIYLSKK